MTTNRRMFLQLGAATMAVLALGPALVVATGPATVLREPAGPLRVLSVKRYSVLAALADAICPGVPSSDGGLLNGSAAQVADKIDALLAAAHPSLGADIGLALDLIESSIVALMLDQRPRRFSACSPEVQAAALEAWRTSAIVQRRQAFGGLSSLINASYWSDPRTYAVSGYPGAPDYGPRDPAGSPAALGVHGSSESSHHTDDPNQPAGRSAPPHDEASP